MAQLELDRGLKSQVLRILVDFGKASIQIVDGKRLFYGEEKTDEFGDIVIAINKKSRRQFMTPERGQEIISFCNRALNESVSNRVSKFCMELNELLSLRTFIVGNTLSAADIVSFVVLYPHFASMKEGERYLTMLNVSRWFDLIQFQLGSSNVLSHIVVPQSVPIPKKKGKDKKAEKRAQCHQNESKEKEPEPVPSENKKSGKKKKFKKQKKGQTVECIHSVQGFKE